MRRASTALFTISIAPCRGGSIRILSKRPKGIRFGAKRPAAPRSDRPILGRRRSRAARGRGAEVRSSRSEELVRDAAARNAEAANRAVALRAADLFAPNLMPFGRFDKILIDPPRQGAIEIVKARSRRGALSTCPAIPRRSRGMRVY